MPLLNRLSRIFKRNPTGALGAVAGAYDNALGTAASDVVSLSMEYDIRTASGWWLDEYGSWFGVPRIAGEDNISYSRRILASVSTPKNTINAIKQAARAYIGDPEAMVDVHEPYTELFIMGESELGDTDKIRDAEYYTWNSIDIISRVPATDLYIQTINTVKAGGVIAHYSYYLDIGNGQVMLMSDPANDNVYVQVDLLNATIVTNLREVIDPNRSNWAVKEPVNVSSGTTMGWSGFTKLQDIYSLTINQLEDTDDIYQLSTQAQTLDMSGNILSTRY